MIFIPVSCYMAEFVKYFIHNDGSHSSVVSSDTSRTLVNCGHRSFASVVVSVCD